MDGIRSRYYERDGQPMGSQEKKRSRGQMPLGMLAKPPREKYYENILVVKNLMVRYCGRYSNDHLLAAYGLPPY